MLKIIDNEKYRIDIEDIQFYGDDTVPIAKIILRAILDWQRKNISSIYLGQTDEKYILTFAGNNVHLIQDVEWPRHKTLSDEAPYITKALCQDIERSLEEFSKFGAESDKEEEINLSEMRALISLIKEFDEATGKAINWDKREKAEENYSKYLIDRVNTQNLLS